MTYCFFDVDGTIVDSTKVILKAFRTAFSQLDIDYPGDNRIEQEFGKSLRTILPVLGIPGHLRDDFESIFTGVEMASDQYHIFDGMRKVIELVTEKLPLVLVTSKQRDTAIHVLDVVGIDYDVLVASDDVEKTKPDPEPLQAARERAGISNSEEIYYIGDSLFDIEAAIAAGMKPVGVYWGSHSEKLVENFADEVIVKSPNELFEFLKKKI